MSDANDPNQPAQGEAFGFKPQPKEEKYNTQYLVSSMNKEKRVTQFVVLGAIALALGVVTWLLLMPGKQHPLPAAPGTEAAAPAAPK